MKPMKFLVPALVLVLAAAGCILVSGQFLVDFDLPNFQATTSSNIVAEQIDLNTNDDYNDHKEDLKAMVDIAVLGKVTNNDAGAVGVEVWMTPGTTNYTTSTEISNNATKLWGPFVVLGNATKTVDWNESAALFTTAGKAMLLSEVKGDGQFTLYAIGNTTTYDINVDNGVLAITLDFGK
ncbi:MAG TPA: hypothetical protein VFU59_09385 [Candidatus Eisenbacteria bacterium]|nr:hypothetical protein [Candidatus Eisenbacteria bacterium]